MQMYNGLPIITNKIPERERNSIPHHLLGTVNLTSEPWTISHFVHESQNIIQEIRSRGKLPILVGGSHYYAQALLLKDSLVAQKPVDVHPSDYDSDPDRSPKWPILLAPTPEIYAKLQEVDPVLAQRWHFNDRRKIIRSLEIWLQTGRRASDVYEEQHQQRIAHKQRHDSAEDTENGNGSEEMSGDGMRYPSIIFWLESHNEALLPRLNSRVDNMVDGGMVEEALSLQQLEKDQIAKGSPVNTRKGIWISIGYKELIPYLTAMRSGDADPANMQKLRESSIEATKIATRQYVMQQRKWIRNRLMGQFEQAAATKQLFLLDSSDLDQWSSAVTKPSQEIVEAFLSGHSLLDPLSLSKLAQTSLLRTSPNGSRHQTFLSRTCEVCNKTMITDLEWELHLKSNRHKKALYGKTKRERGEARRKELGIEDRALADLEVQG